jgi:hypothetical protein
MATIELTDEELAAGMRDVRMAMLALELLKQSLREYDGCWILNCPNLGLLVSAAVKLKIDDVELDRMALQEIRKAKRL